MWTLRRTGAAVVAAVMAASVVAACGGDDDDAAGDDAPAAEDTQSGATDGESAGGDGDEGAEQVTLTVSNLPPTTEESTREQFLQRVEEFEAANPNIDVEPSEYEWDVATFAAQLAGGTLPTVFQIPFTDVAGLVENGQIADITAEVAELPYAERFNENVLAVAEDGDGNLYGLPFAAYGIGLHYNRTLFTEAGLDPEDPPETWDEVRTYAKAIADATDAAGYAQMSQSNTGGWMLTSLTYAHGGRMQTGTGEDLEVTVDNDGTKAGLELLSAMRWEDDSMGDNFLYDWGTINQDFAAGKIGMYMGGSDVYNSLVTENSIDPDSYGLTVLPLSGDDAGVLGGGSVGAIKADASDAERAAGVRWIDFFYLSKLTDQDAAVADASSLAESGAPVGTPALPIFGAEQLAESDAWVAEYVNVPLEQMAGFTEGIGDQPLIPEPTASTQDMYARLDSVVQAVLTDEGADIDDLLADADADVTGIVEG